ncbi:chaperonin CPN60, mitochondrial-like [Aphidius gifuensis]|uniref:chaperonin CPN60, mitochondrial-like n=1 Tax=Aphidius gifuensis TaxID=684658 RepID=UPI001CDB5C3E|nr:chaperonin CPN60, mitochondrial-like [Aphidius gifuensis]
MEDQENVEKLGRGLRSKTLKRFSFPPRDDVSRGAAKQQKLDEVKKDAIKTKKLPRIQKEEVMKESDRKILEIIKRKKALQFKKPQEMSSLYEDDENPRPSFNMSPKNLDDAGSSLDNESWKSPQSYIGEETYHVKKNNFLESSSRNSKFCMKSKILKQHSNSSKRDVETENAVEILTAEKASLVTKNEELEKEIKLLQEMTQNLQDAEKKMQNDLSVMRIQYEEMKNESQLHVNLNSEIQEIINSLHDEMREDLKVFGEQLVQNIVDALNETGRPAVQEIVNDLEIIDGKVRITENVSMNVETYMKACQAFDMRKRANIAMRGLWKSDDLAKFVKKKSSKNQKIITEDDILLLQVAIMKMQAHKSLLTKDAMDISNLSNWIAYQAKMIRTREKAKLDDASTDESAESDEQSEDDSRDKQIKKIAFVSTDKVSHDDEDGSSSVDENEGEDDPLTDESQE